MILHLEKQFSEFGFNEIGQFRESAAEMESKILFFSVRFTDCLETAVGLKEFLKDLDSFEFVDKAILDHFGPLINYCMPAIIRKFGK